MAVGADRVTGPVQFSEPRAVRVREPETQDQHSAVHGTLAIYTDSLTESHAVLRAWPEIMAAVAEKAREVIDSSKQG
ncbi:hypothetical protein SEA_Phreeze_57 [Mycobacterium phage Phreeze]|nr:hypothetical protein SEA_Phreeze_57 [Mycobacterium phage Phreeze]